MLAQLIVSVFLACDTKIEDVETHVCSSMCGEGYDTTISVEHDVFLNYVNDGVFDNESCQILCEDEGVSADCCGFVEENHNKNLSGCCLAQNLCVSVRVRRPYAWGLSVVGSGFGIE